MYIWVPEITTRTSHTAIYALGRPSTRAITDPSSPMRHQRASPPASTMATPSSPSTAAPTPAAPSFSKRYAIAIPASRSPSRIVVASLRPSAKPARLAHPRHSRLLRSALHQRRAAIQPSQSHRPGLERHRADRHAPLSHGLWHLLPREILDRRPS